MTTKTIRSKDAAHTRKSAPAPAPGSKPKAAPAPGSAASARLRKQARAAVAANLAALERAETGSAPGSDAGPVAHSEQGGQPHEPQQPGQPHEPQQPGQPQPDQQQREQPDQQPAPGTTPAKKAKASAKSSAAKPKAEKVTKPKPATAPKPPKAEKAPKPKRLSCIDAAAQIIGKDPIGCKDLIAEMGQRKLWSSPSGKTPDASLYAAIIREIAAKGSQARFKKVDRGLFVANSAGRSGGKGA